MKKHLRNNEGFTLLEFVIVIGLAAMLIGVTTLLITKGRSAVNVSTTQERLRIISTGLSEYFLYKNSFPAQNVVGSWPDALASYVESEFRSGDLAHLYMCLGNDVTIQTPAFESANVASAIMDRLVDQNLCATAAVSGTAIQCVLKDFAGIAKCKSTGK
ncbi:MAG: hypothetical protein A4E60_00005 [Syntrophorhabdus sp. PtaB.Bin047]|jgi:type II secretory pathway pseudopilin PulG|nr:MAG: hypothetical protein A4E60_00005 [Syntrophorhabdus sp. PtaB.Bin047]